MTRFSFSVSSRPDGVGIAVTRLVDSAVKQFFIAGNKNVDAVAAFMSSLTDDQCDSYFPKVKKS